MSQSTKHMAMTAKTNRVTCTQRWRERHAQGELITAIPV